ncbi:MAG: hypothetical protein QW594_03430 [Candidatus Woesearchaeota archaeon]
MKKIANKTHHSAIVFLGRNRFHSYSFRFSILFFMVVFFLFALAGCSKTEPKPMQAPMQDPDMKNEAVAFALEIIHAYTTNDCERIYAALHDPLYSLDDVPPVPKSEIKESLCHGITHALFDGPVSYTDYLHLFKPTVYEYPVFMAKYPFFSTLTTFEPQAHDYYFVGYLPYRPEDRDKIISYEYFVFLLRKTDEGWRIIAYE